jgi:LCP family protein required for cell wall assembly
MPGARRRGPRRTWPQRLLISFNVVCIVAALFGAATLTYAKRKVHQINRVDLTQSAFVGSADIGSKDPRNFLIVGADSDAGLSADDPVRNGRDKGADAAGGIRSDTIMIVRIDPRSTQAQILSFPRDLWIDIPGRARNRINAALEFGGPDLLIEAIKQDFGISVNHYVQVDFAAFKSLVNLLNGVPVYFPTPVRDTHSGLNIQNAGCTNLDQNGALQYVRSRHFQYFDKDRGRWASDPSSDLGRISRQQDFIKRVIRRAVHQGARNPVKLASFVDVAVKNITLDGSTKPKDLIDLGRAFRNFDPDRLQTYSLPVTDTVHGGAAVLDLQEAPAEPILERFRGTASTSTNAGDVLPSTVSVRVKNGTGKQNQASTTSDALGRAGFHMEPPEQAASNVGRTEVRYLPGQEKQAALVARYLYANPVLISDVDATVITVVTGPDFAAVLSTPRPAKDVPVPTTTSTTTTAPPSVTTSTLPGVTTTLPVGVTTTTRPGYVPGAAPAGADCS